MNTEIFLEKSISSARMVTDLSLLVRMDAGNDSIENLKVCVSEKVIFIIKRNPRREKPENWLISPLPEK